MNPSDILVSYTQRGEGVPEGGKAGTLSLREGSLDRRMLIPCANAACKKGGFLLRREIDQAVEAAKPSLELTKACAGYTGALRTEKGGPEARCPNTLDATVTLAYPKAPA